MIILDFLADRQHSGGLAVQEIRHRIAYLQGQNKVFVSSRRYRQHSIGNCRGFLVYPCYRSDFSNHVLLLQVALAGNMNMSTAAVTTPPILTYSTKVAFTIRRLRNKDRNYLLSQVNCIGLVRPFKVILVTYVRHSTSEQNKKALLIQPVKDKVKQIMPKSIP